MRMEFVSRSNVSGIDIILDQAAEITALRFAYENQTSKAAVQEGSLCLRHHCNFVKEADPWPYWARKEGEI